MSPTTVPEHGRIEVSDFRPHPLLSGPHLQTILANLLQPLPPLPIRRERIDLDDGDFLELGWAGEGDGPLVLLLHGLSGSFESKYLRGTARRLIQAGLRCVILEMRGAGLEPNRLPRSYHHGATEDIQHVVDLLARREPRATLAAAGWSLGANVLLKYLGEAGSASPLSCAVAASAPFQLKPCAERLRTGFSRIYQTRLLRDLKASLQRKYASIPATVDLDAVYAARDFFEFDNAHTAPVNGFANAEDYYTRAACGSYLHAIRRPTLIVHAADDPFMVREILPREQDLAPCVTLELAEQGGHVGFLAAGRFGLPELWLERRMSQWLIGQLQVEREPQAEVVLA